VAAEPSDAQKVLTDEILADAGRQADRIRRRAERDARDIAGQAVRQAEDERDRRLAEARAEADRRRRLTLATVPVEEGRLRLRRIEDVLEAIRDEAARRLRARDGFDYREAVRRLAAEAVRGMQGTMFVLALAEADRQALGHDLAEAVRRRAGRDGLQVTLAPQAAAIGGGVIVRDAEGRRQWDNSLAARLARLWPALRRRIAETTGLLEVAEAAARDTHTSTQEEA
jgi:V/A-type H+-transporting ATPase subunit E